MELPFAVIEEDESRLPPGGQVAQKDGIAGDLNSTSSSLVTASSQGSLIDSDADLIPILSSPPPVQHQHQMQHQHPSQPIVSNVPLSSQQHPSARSMGRPQSQQHHHSHGVGGAAVGVVQSFLPRLQILQPLQQQHQHQSRPPMRGPQTISPPQQSPSDPTFVDTDFAYIDIPQGKPPTPPSTYGRGAAPSHEQGRSPNNPVYMQRNDADDDSDLDIFVDAEVGGDHQNIDDDEDYEYGRATSGRNNNSSSSSNNNTVNKNRSGGNTLHQNRGDILALLLSGGDGNENFILTEQLKDAGVAAVAAAQAKQNGQLEDALSQHTKSANLYRDSAIRAKKTNRPLSNSLLLLSQTQAKSAIALKRIMKLNSTDLERLMLGAANQIADGASKPTKGSKSSNSNTTSQSNQNAKSSNGSSSPATKDMSKEERLRAVVRGALGSGHPREADISDSMFLGRASSSSNKKQSRNDMAASSSLPNAAQDERKGGNANGNPVDEMMELEQELRDMDMTLGLGQSISSLDARMQYANAAHSSSNKMMKNSMIDGSFMVVPPGSQSYMASSLWGGSSSIHMPSGNSPPGPASSTATTTNATATTPAAVGHKSGVPRGVMTQPAQIHAHGTAGVRARANRLPNMTTSRVLNAQGTNNSSNNLAAMQHQNVIVPGAQSVGKIAPADASNNNSSNSNKGHGLESSWWGGPAPGTTTAAASQVLANSVLSIGSRTGGVLVGGGGGGIDRSANAHGQGIDSATTKQVMRLMDALKTLGDENATLLRQVEDAEAARAEAKAAREQMKRFKADFAKRFATLQSSLQSHRKAYGSTKSSGDVSGTDHNKGGSTDPFTTSEYIKALSANEKLQRQEQLIRKLTADLKKEKDESRKKAAALRKYEHFYREVKVRSAQKTAARRQQQQQPDEEAKHGTE
eukprot:CAMPEP_0119554884 /NCGR_PEP_ID=MMETSP1352-20130426/7242_1 /TAXON_ID=265584 /ORGANISM="Stauroneis constricta, Strain CCMP1120" /LENGTH=915 /DNA_ID=CAMNT_0007601547 /DNA_START=245 /DNA_END=2992 /DNA_ORIENTATION=-